MKTFLAGVGRFLLGLVMCGVGALGAFAVIVLTVQLAWGWVFLTGPAAIAVGIVLLARGTKLVANSFH